jgi:hypothetical protein
VLTGRLPYNPAARRPHHTPTHLRLEFHKWANKEGGLTDLADRVSVEVEINSYDGEKPDWVESNYRKNGIDLALKEVLIPEEAAIISVNTMTQNDYSLDFGTGTSLSIYGFPSGLTGQGRASPIAKSGYAATHPRGSYKGWPRFLMDARTYRGMSGGPVFVNQAGRERYFLGVYSGRLYGEVVSGVGELEDLPKSREETDFGYCWKAEMIPYMINEGRVHSSQCSTLSILNSQVANDDVNPQSSTEERWKSHDMPNRILAKFCGVDPSRGS